MTHLAASPPGLAADPRRNHTGQLGTGLLGRLTLALVAAILVAETLGATRFKSQWWGVHSYGFLPTPLLWSAVAAVVAASLVLLLYSPRLDPLLVRTSSFIAAWPRWLLPALGLPISLFLFWTLRESHTLLGDGNPLTSNLPQGENFHPDEPLTLLIHHGWYRLTGSLFMAPGRDAASVAQATVGLSSAIAGAVFIPIAWRLASDLAGHRTRGIPSEAREDLASAMLVFLVLVSQGYMQLFFGYVENYTFYMVAVGAYALAGFRALTGRGSLAAASAVLVLALGLHLSAATLVPSFCVLAIRCLWVPESRWRAVRDLPFASTRTAVL